MPNIMNLFSMRPILPPVGAGRVHLCGDAQTAEAHDRSVTPKRRMEAMQRRKKILRMIASGINARLDVAKACSVSSSTVESHCNALIIDGLVRSRIIKGARRYYVTSAGLLAMEAAA